MSSEMYLRWEVEKLEKIHGELQMQLAREREEQSRLLRQMNKSLANINSLIASAKNAAGNPGSAPAAKSQRVSNIRNYDTNEIVSSGYSSDIENAQVVSFTDDKRHLTVIDWSDQLNAFETATSDKAKKFIYAQEISSALSLASTESPDDVRTLNEFVSYLNNLLCDDDLDYDYFKKLIDIRFSSLKRKIEFFDSEELAEEVSEYYALCKLLDITPEKVKKQNISEVNHKLQKKLFEREEEKYVYKNLMEVFSELNMNVAEEMELDGLPGRRITDDSLSDCTIFMSMDKDGIVFETVAELEAPDSLSSNQKAIIEESAHKVCKKHLQVIQKMQERGIYLKIECEEKPKAEHIRKVKKNAPRKIARNKTRVQSIGG